MSRDYKDGVRTPVDVRVRKQHKEVSGEGASEMRIISGYVLCHEAEQGKVRTSGDVSTLTCVAIGVRLGPGPLSLYLTHAD